MIDADFDSDLDVLDDDDEDDVDLKSQLPFRQQPGIFGGPKTGLYTSSQRGGKEPSTRPSPGKPSPAKTRASYQGNKLGRTTFSPSMPSGRGAPN